MAELIAVLLGLVEGLTEFLPVSSTGHLILFEDALGFAERLGPNGKETAQAFTVIIQGGAILAVLAAYPRRFADLIDFRRPSGFAGMRALTLLFITSLPAGLLALATRKFIHEHFFNPLSVALALACGAVWILLVDRSNRTASVETLDRFTWRNALSVGLFQCLALWPGMSRSTATILGGMHSGVDRRAATEYSFLAAVPLLTAASLYELYRARHSFDAAHLGVFAIGFVVSFITALAAIKLFVRFLQRHTLVAFAWYRLGLAALVLSMLFRS